MIVDERTPNLKNLIFNGDKNVQGSIIRDKFQRVRGLCEAVGVELHFGDTTQIISSDCGYEQIGLDDTLLSAITTLIGRLSWLILTMMMISMLMVMMKKILPSAFHRLALVFF
jgi:hypothetical protein